MYTEWSISYQYTTCIFRGCSDILLHVVSAYGSECEARLTSKTDQQKSSKVTFTAFAYILNHSRQDCRVYLQALAGTALCACRLCCSDVQQAALWLQSRLSILC